eukprot:1895384-Amphidinium_carterae.2
MLSTRPEAGCLFVEWGDRSHVNTLTSDVPISFAIWRLEQALKGNGPYTLVRQRFETANAVWQEVNLTALPDDPSRRAYVRYRQLS